MKKYMILFSVGKDRPGIVDDVSSFLFERGANIEDSRMAVMGGCFSIMILFACSPERMEAIRVELESLGELGLKAVLHEAEDPAITPVRPALPLKIEVMAMDHPGIVQKVVRILRDHNINIHSLNTEIKRAPLSGADLFNLNLQAAVPVGKPITDVKEQLMALAAELNLDLSFK
jgi:glycine cleavage system transcriptional repressor